MRERISVRVITRASKNLLEMLPDGMFRAYVTPAPEKGKANEAVIRLISKHFSIPKTSISVVRGAASNKKIVEIETNRNLFSYNSNI